MKRILRRFRLKPDDFAEFSPLKSQTSLRQLDSKLFSRSEPVDFWGKLQDKGCLEREQRPKLKFPDSNLRVEV